MSQFCHLTKITSRVKPPQIRVHTFALSGRLYARAKLAAMPPTFVRIPRSTAPQGLAAPRTPCPGLLPAAVPFLWANTTSSAPPARFRSAWVSDDGMIVQKEGCRAIKSGGCAKHMYRQWAEPNVSTTHDRVVTLATHFGDGHYHFPIEALTALARRADLLTPASVLHVSKKTDFVQQWLALVGLAAYPVVDGSIFARELSVPRPAKCSEPTTEQLLWLRSLVMNALGLTGSAKPDSLLLVKRANFSQTASNNKRRVIANFESAVQAPAEAHARAHSLRFVLFDDASLPPLREQLRLFSRAKMIVAPLGAGEVGIVAAPSGACLVELADPMRTDKYGGAHSHEDQTYAHLAHLLGHRYERVPTPGLTADQATVRAAMSRCQEGAQS